MISEYPGSGVHGQEGSAWIRVAVVRVMAFFELIGNSMVLMSGLLALPYLVADFEQFTHRFLIIYGA